LGDDVVADRKAEPGALAGGLGGEKWLEQLVAVLGLDAGAVIAHANLDPIGNFAGGDFEHRPKGRVAGLPAALAGGVEAVADQVEEDAGDILRNQLDRCDRGGEIALQGDVEILVLGAGYVIGEVEVVLDEGVEVGGLALAAAA